MSGLSTLFVILGLSAAGLLVGGLVGWTAGKITKRWSRRR